MYIKHKHEDPIRQRKTDSKDNFYFLMEGLESLLEKGKEDVDHDEVLEEEVDGLEERVEESPGGTRLAFCTGCHKHKRDKGSQMAPYSH